MADQAEILIAHAHLGEIRAEIGERLRCTEQPLSLPSNLILLLSQLDHVAHTERLEA
jgi:hypothetical protein